MESFGRAPLEDSVLTAIRELLSNFESPYPVNLLFDSLMENTLDKESRQWAMICHLSALIGIVIPLGSLIGPLVVWLIKKETMPFVDEQGKEAVNFNITVILISILLIPLVFIVIGIPLLILVGLGAVILMIIAALKANDGVSYRYPFTLRLIK